METIGDYEPKKIGFFDVLLGLTERANWKVLQNAMRLENDEIKYAQIFNLSFEPICIKNETIKSAKRRYHLVGGRWTWKISL